MACTIRLLNMLSLSPPYQLCPTIDRFARSTGCRHGGFDLDVVHAVLISTGCTIVHVPHVYETLNASRAHIDMLPILVEENLLRLSNAFATSVVAQEPVSVVTMDRPIGMHTDIWAIFQPFQWSFWLVLVLVLAMGKGIVWMMPLWGPHGRPKPNLLLLALGMVIFTSLYRSGLLTSVLFTENEYLVNSIEDLVHLPEHIKIYGSKQLWFSLIAGINDPATKVALERKSFVHHNELDSTLISELQQGEAVLLATELRASYVLKSCPIGLRRQQLSIPLSYAMATTKENVTELLNEAIFGMYGGIENIMNFYQNYRPEESVCGDEELGGGVPALGDDYSRRFAIGLRHMKGHFGIMLAGTAADCTCGPELTNIPQTLPIELRKLTVKNCPIRRLEAEQFTRYRNLQALTLTGHKITKIEEFTFRGLNQLKTLIISNNTELKNLTAGSLGGIHSNGHLKIYLKNNSITDISGYVFSDTRGLYDIIFGDDSQIRTIRKHAFSGLYHVRYLKLPLFVEKIEEEAFDNFTRLHHLQIQKWQAARHGGIAPKTFAGLRHVKSISVVKSKLGTIHEHAFSGTHVVQQIDISDCKIGRIRRRAFIGFDLSTSRLRRVHPTIHHAILTPFPGIRSVGLITFRHNQIGRLDRNFFHYVNVDREAIKFEFNNFNCSCRNMWVFDPESAERIPRTFLTDNYCSWPPDYQNRRLSDLPATWIQKCQLVNFGESASTARRTHLLNGDFVIFAILSTLLAFVHIPLL